MLLPAPVPPAIRTMKAWLILGLALPLRAMDWSSALHELRATGEGLVASDIRLMSFLGEWSAVAEGWEVELGLGLNDYRLDYAPTILGVPNRLSEETWRTSASLTREWSPRWSTTLRGRYYDGYAEYRSIWIAEFYRQLFGATPQYFGPDPHGGGVGISLSWEYLPNVGRVELAYDYGRDIIAPGWAFDPNLGAPAPEPDTLDTHAATVRVEHALAPWLETELLLSARDTTSRDPRYSVRNAWAAEFGALGLRAGIGYSEEKPGFEAFYGDLLLEWALGGPWAAYTGFRLYTDTGEIENSGFNALAPELESSEVFVGVRYDDGSLAVNLGLGFLDSDYSTIPPSSAFFGNLYRDREWWSGRISASYQF